MSPTTHRRRSVALLVLLIATVVPAMAQDLTVPGILHCSGGRIHSPGRMHISGGELLFLLNRDGVIVSKAWGGNGNLSVEGHLQTSGALIATGGHIHSPGRCHVDGGERLYLLNREGVFVSRAWGGSGSLFVEGPTTCIGPVQCNSTLKSAAISAGRLEVRSDWWADDVFADGYRLRSLDEVRGFIADNGHLPDVPSAARLAEDGLDVHGMLATQMRKIEELTLYTFAQDDRLRAQDAELREQRAALAALRADLDALRSAQAR